MIEIIRQYLAARPFRPFTIVTTGGSRYFVASNEHAFVSPPPHRVVVWFDDGGAVTIAALHIASVETQASQVA